MSMQKIAVGGVLAVASIGIVLAAADRSILTLSVSPNTSDITNFTFDMIITGTEKT